VIFPATFGYVAILVAYATWTDIRRRIIPNAIVLTLLGIFALRWAVMPASVDILPDLALAAAAFGFGYLSWHLRAVGAGDVKLIAVLALWFGLAHAPLFLIVMALAGGAMSLGYIVVRSSPAVQYLISKVFPSVWEIDWKSNAYTRTPYAVAICAGTFPALFQQAAAFGVI
jgi:prepilin peptidase CpaA